MSTQAWGDLEKSITDPSTIDQEIDAKIITHLDDPDAHLLAGQSLQSHKASEIIDHLARSIVTDKLAEYAVTAIESSRSILTADCVVAASGGDYTTIQAAISAGEQVIYVKSGTYTVNSDIVSAEGVSIIGENKYTTIIDFNNSAHGFDFTGTPILNNIHTVLTGFTIKNSASVAILADYIDDINIHDCIFDNNVQIIDIGFTSLSYIGEININNNVFKNNGSVKIALDATSNISVCYFENNKMTDCNPSFLIIDSGSEGALGFVEGNVAIYSSLQASGNCFSVDRGFVDNNFISYAFAGIYSEFGSVSNNFLYHIKNIGIEITTSSCTVVGNIINDVAGGSDEIGIYVNGCDTVNVSSNTLGGVASQCIRLYISGYSNICSNTCSGSSVGISISSGSNYNVVVGNKVSENTTPTTNGGTGNTLANNA